MPQPVTYSGQLRKMEHEFADPIQYFLSLDEKRHEVSSQIGRTLTLEFGGTITCIECDRKIKKTYDQGYCFPCSRDLPENDMCAVRPELCEHDKGNEASQEFWRNYCNVDHFVYLSLTSGVKVGVTRHWNIPSRWIDQGAVQGLIIAKTPERKLAGKIEIALAEHMADKTNWRKMIKGEVETVNLPEWRDKVATWVPDDLKNYLVYDEPVQQLSYPVEATPPKISSHNLDKDPSFTDRLTGIKGQYLIMEKKVINLRKYGGYHLKFQFTD